ncbi:MAG: GMC family oxidoreductase N-terminal domain-containing protein [Planktotalea sp.]|uniref:GMC family oxidoreductase n=1 Tax=Planktotalea sp. TaxID=2029877 RepID=UPI003C78E940
MTRTLDFDYVVVGGGSAGCVMAARLAAQSGGSVALVERGRGDTNRWIHIPGTFFKALQGQDADAVTSEPDASLGGLPFNVPQGRVLGGGSSVNGMIYMRGQARDYDDWADIHGCTGWAYKDVLPIFRRQEKNARFSDEFHGTKGALVVSDPSAPHPVSKRIIEAAIAAGIPATDDFNGGTQEGAGWYQVTAHGGQRQSAAHCFLKPELGRENLQVLTGLMAQRLRIEGRRARAVEAKDSAGNDILIRAAREIVLTAGSFHSPKLLMLSGIGPRAELLRHGIDVVHDAAEVGANYQDHVGAPVTRMLTGMKGLYGQDKGFAAIKNGIDYFLFRRGLLTSNILDAGACADTDGDGRPDVQFNFAPFAPSRPGQPPMACQAVQVHPMTMRPKSRGRLGLQSRDPADQPSFIADALAHPEDLDTLRRGVRLAQDIFAQTPLRDIVGDEIWPGEGVNTSVGSNNLDDAIRAQARTIFHPAGTCRMGPTPSSVVDLQLRVNGVEGLRVADCSIMPALVSGNTNAPTMMIADKAADAILNG